MKLKRWPTASNARNAFNGSQRRLTVFGFAMGLLLTDPVDPDNNHFRAGTQPSRSMVRHTGRRVS
ncbi:MAG TPA: hypothetical protein VF649_11575 [Sphingomonas sp.]|uniref:hypothetical protein n=1 Tax=Sphingomonas sp. TaxID=28214 RepID=UPI002ED7886D